MLEELSKGPQAFALRAGRRTLNIGDRYAGTHPIVSVPLREFDIRQVSNLRIEIICCWPKHQVVELTVSEACEQVADIGQRLSLEEVYLARGRIHLGEAGQLVLKEIDEDGRAHFRVALDRSLKIKSPELYQL